MSHPAGVEATTVPLYRFQNYELDTDVFELRRDGAACHLEPRAFEVLTYLVANAERLVTKHEIIEQVWETPYISDAALTTCIKDARHAVGDDGQAQRVIKTVHGRGYRFVAPVEVRVGGGGTAEAATPVLPVPPIEQAIRFCTTPDGVRIAYATSGTGPPLVKVANWLTNLEFDPISPVWRHLLSDLAPGRTLVRYDERGCGLSDWDVEDFGVDVWVQDLETVVATLDVERFPLLGISQGGAVAISYAVRHPERVSHLILQGAYARGRSLRSPGEREEAEALVVLAQQGWGRTGSAYAQLFSAHLIPNATPEQLRWLSDLQRVSTSSENAVRFRRAFNSIDVSDLLPHVRVPTLVIHSRGDPAIPFEEGRRLAAGIPDSRLVPLESDNHLVLHDEPAWQVYRGEVREFLGDRLEDRAEDEASALTP